LKERAGKLAIPLPPKTPEPLLIAHPVKDEATQVDGVLGPAPGSSSPRSLSPPPMASPREVEAIEEMAQSTGQRLTGPKRSLSPVPFEAPRRVEYGIESGTRTWLIALATMLFGTSGVAIYGAVRDPSPPAVQEAPKKLDDQQRDLSRVRDDVAECRSDLRETEGDVKRLQRRTESLERKLYELEKNTPKINP